MDPTATIDAAPTPTPAADPTPAPTPLEETKRQAFLLQQLADAPGHKLESGVANRKIPRATKDSLGLTTEVANRVRGELVAKNYLSIHKDQRKVSYQLTPEGRAYLEALPADVRPSVGPRGKIMPPSNDDVRREREAYLLLRLLKDSRHTQNMRDANASLPKGLELNAATATHIRHDMAARGLITIHRHGRSETYTLTAAGRLHLGTLDFYATSRFNLTGRVLNELLDAAREVAKQFAAPEPTPHAAAPHDLERNVMEAIEELLRERHLVTGLVPIHEVRAHLRQQSGDLVAQHNVLDEVLLRLHRDGRLKLSAISDHNRSTPEELQASIPGVGETLFYVEVAHEPALR